ncbi:hypothetical protein TrRE_jg7368, partial [Triparma retinervis]
LCSFLSLSFGICAGHRDISIVVTFLQLIITICVAINLRDVRQSQLYWRVHRSTINAPSIGQTNSSPMRRVEEEDIEDQNYLDDEDEIEMALDDRNQTRNYSML